MKIPPKRGDYLRLAEIATGGKSHIPIIRLIRMWERFGAGHYSSSWCNIEPWTAVFLTSLKYGFEMAMV
jgi:hypothetical protein